ncbi:cysteine-rich repeat secretory protein 1-like [Brachypodium distachyon]|uniref:cysteine-rich repeat secretory protein 1-like n=1 Tax=Brachypodium distachyon TaxID=15368 RepID=UPI000D0D4619|nr:cysteine-rich repeat secretory protein 1-like [Brachypodium distachyon]|eukprot:XP_024318870.1 cysteine-rich repeat secretory protein 1-like [Brachypodium distachyon]
MLLLALVVGSSFIGTAYGNNTTPLVTYCSPERNFTVGSKYQQNLDKLVHALGEGALGNGGFLNGSVGGPGPDDEAAFGVIMCYVDRTSAQCKDCLGRAQSFVSTGCPFNAAASIMYKFCVLQYAADEPSISFPVAGDGMFRTYRSNSSHFVDDVAAMNGTRWELMNRLVPEAAGSPLRAEGIWRPAPAPDVSTAY